LTLLFEEKINVTM